MIKKIIIAIDGHSSTGKSTLAKMLSDYLNYKHINTGAMYRSVTLYALRNNWIKDLKHGLEINKTKIINSIDHLSLDFKFDKNKTYNIYMNDEDVSVQIKSHQISKYVSQVSAYSLVREKIVSMQKKMGISRGVVMEGRDIGSVVFPDAELKLFITASVEVRAERRYNELLKLGMCMDFKEVLGNLKMRDSSDSSRKNSPLIKVRDAILIDNTSMNIEEQFSFVISILKNKKIV